jgi:hypothetical protein
MWIIYKIHHILEIISLKNVIWTLDSPPPFYPEPGVEMFLQNVSGHMLIDMTSQPRKS